MAATTATSDPMTTGQAARALGVEVWQMARALRRAGRDFPRVGPFRAIPAAALPELREALVAAGYLPPAPAAAG